MLQSYSCLLGHEVPLCKNGPSMQLAVIRRESTRLPCGQALCLCHEWAPASLHRSLLNGGSPVGVPRKTALGILVSRGPAWQLPRHCRLACLHDSTAWPVDSDL